MSNPFDASFAYNEPLSSEVIEEHRRSVEGMMPMPSALANAKLHAERELQRLVQVCNRVAWGNVPADGRKPNPEEISELLGQLSPEDRDRLIRESRLASEQRHLVGLMNFAERQQTMQLEAEQDELAKRESEQRELEEFEAYDEAEKPKRFDAWRKSRRGQR